VDIVTQNKETVQFEVLTDNGQTVEDSSRHSYTEQTVQCEVLTDSGENLEDRSGRSNTEQKESTV